MEICLFLKQLIFLLLLPMVSIMPRVNAVPGCQINRSDMTNLNDPKIRSARSIRRQFAQLFHGGRQVSPDEMKSSIIMAAVSNLMLQGVHTPYSRRDHMENEQLLVARPGNGRNQSKKSRGSIIKSMMGGKSRIMKNRSKMMGKLKKYFTSLLLPQQSTRRPDPGPEDDGRNYYDSHENAMALDHQFGGGRRAYWI